jgi:hypothetical protein
MGGPGDGTAMLRLVWGVVIGGALLLMSCTHFQRLRCLRDDRFTKTMSLVANGRTEVGETELLEAFGGDANVSESSISTSIQDEERGCICCVTFDVKRHPNSPTIKVDKVFLLFFGFLRGREATREFTRRALAAG